ncbi:MAG: hypothetical protein KAT43_03070 [Nanoarchaeota archaeon]|nr:hypothetical protein [Nanoarchaeota archaeon]
MKKASIALILITVLLLFTLSGCTPIGKAGWATRQSIGNITQDVIIQQCVDSDGKQIDPYTQNYVTYNNQRYYDRCIAGGSGIMEEATCTRNTLVYQQYPCGKEGNICYNGACVKPGECAIPLDCGLDEPVGMPYCRGNDIALDFRIFECNPQGNIAFIAPGAICTDKITRLKLHTCSNSTQCDGGTCLTPCKSDNDCTSGSTDKCIRGFCTVDNTYYTYCYDSDHTKPNIDLLNDYSFMIPSTTIRITPPQEGAPTVMYFNDFCDILVRIGGKVQPGVVNPNPTVVEEHYCQNNQVRIHHTVECSNLQPIGTYQSCQFYRSHQTNRYVGWPANIGACS